MEENLQSKQKLGTSMNNLNQSELDTANREVYELKQVISLLEHVVEEISKENLFYQKKISEISDAGLQSNVLTENKNSTLSKTKTNQKTVSLKATDSIR